MRILFGLLLILHGLAHAAAGTQAQGAVWLVTTLWWLTTVCFVGSGLWLLGARFPWPRVDRVAYAGALASTGLLAYFPFSILVPGALLNLCIIAALLNVPWLTARPPVDAAHQWRSRFGTGLAGVFLVYAAAMTALHPWFQRYGTTAADRAMPLFGDSLLPTGDVVQTDNAITIRAPADSVWPWLAQVGQDRGGFYSYAWLENLFGDEITNADSIVPAWQQRAVGDLVRAVQPDYLGGVFGDQVGWRITGLDPGRAFVLAAWGSFVVLPIDDRTSRLHLRSRWRRSGSVATVVLGPASVLALHPAHFVMQRGMLIGIRERAERAAQSSAGSTK